MVSQFTSKGHKTPIFPKVKSFSYLRCKTSRLGLQGSKNVVIVISLWNESGDTQLGWLFSVDVLFCPQMQWHWRLGRQANLGMLCGMGGGLTIGFFLCVAFFFQFVVGFGHWSFGRLPLKVSKLHQLQFYLRCYLLYLKEHPLRSKAPCIITFVKKKKRKEEKRLKKASPFCAFSIMGWVH